MKAQANLDPGGSGSAGGKVGIEELLGRADWIRALARRLAAGEAEADDLVQETWIAAQKNPPDQSRSLRPWVAQVLRNLVGVRRRNQARRRERERAYQGGLPAAATSVGEIYERVELERFVATLVMSLDEPLRAVVILRYFEGLDATAIGKLTGVAPGTVRWRLKTALDQLRVSLDKKHGGDRRKWVAILLPAGAPAGLETARPEAMARAPLLSPAGIALAAMAGIVIVMAVFGLLWSHGAQVAEAPGPQLASPTPAGRTSPRLGAEVEVGDAAELEGLVIDAAGRPVAHALVVAELGAGDFSGTLGFAARRPPATVATDAAGRFTLLGLPPGRTIVTASKAGTGAGHLPAFHLAPRERRAALVLKLAAAEAGVFGRVLDAGGGPVVGARVLARLGGRTPDDLTYLTLSGADGGYRLDLPPGRYNLQAEADGYAPRQNWVFLHVPIERDFRLEPASRIAGRVLGPTGAPVAGAQVFAINTDINEGRTTTLAVSDAAGGFAFGDLDVGAYRLLARAEGLVGEHSTPLGLGLHTERAGIEISLAPGRRIEGQVRGPGGVPVPGADVQAFAENLARTRSDDAGRFVLQGLRAEQLYIAASAPSYGPARMKFDVRTGNVTGAVLDLVPAAVVSGTVVDPSGRPAAGAHLIASVPHEGDRGGLDNRGEISDASGNFRIDRVPAGALKLKVTHQTGSADLGPLPLAAGEQRSLTVKLDAGGSVTGRVRREDGSPATGAQVFASVFGRQPAPTAVAQVGADGTYLFAALPPGEVVLIANQGSHDPLLAMANRQPDLEQVTVRLQTGERRTDVDLRLRARQLELRGRVQDERARPVAGAYISASPNNTGVDPSQGRVLSDDDGRFVISGLARGPHTALVRHPDFGARNFDGLAPGDADVTLVLPAAAALKGVVVGENGKPVPAYHLVARPRLAQGAPEWERWRHWWNSDLPRQRLSRPDGRFALERLGPGSYDLAVFVAGGGAGYLTGVELAAGQSRDDLRIVVRAGVTLRGRVIDAASGTPIAKARVQSRGIAAGNQLEAFTDAQGRFELSGFPSGGVIQFTVMGPSDRYMRDANHRLTPAAGDTLELGDVRLFAGPMEDLNIRGPVRTGLSVHTRESGPFVHAVYPRGPADKAGARAGDAVLKIDGHDVSRGNGSIVEGLLGSGGKTVTATLQRNGGAPFEVQITRE